MVEGERGRKVQYRFRRMVPADVEAVARFHLQQRCLPSEVAKSLPDLLQRLLREQRVFGGITERLWIGETRWEMAACGLACYMADALYERYFSEPFPCLLSYVLAQVYAGAADEVMLPWEEVAERQRHGPPRLDLVVLSWLLDNYDPASDDTWHLMFQGYGLMDRFLSGVRLRSFVHEGEARNRVLFEATGYARLIDFSNQPNADWKICPQGARLNGAMHGISTVEDHRRNRFNSPVARMFAFREPFLDLSIKQKMILDLALEGYRDSEIACILGITPNAVRMRWRGIYEKMQAALPGIFNERADVGRGGRGQEKRRIAIHYIRDHPEEIRPVLVLPEEPAAHDACVS